MIRTSLIFIGHFRIQNQQLIQAKEALVKDLTDTKSENFQLRKLIERKNSIEKGQK